MNVSIGQFVLCNGQWYVVDAIEPEGLYVSDKEGGDHFLKLGDVEAIGDEL